VTRLPRRYKNPLTR